MKINPILYNEAFRAYDKVERTSPSQTVQSGVDEVTFSEKAVSFSQIMATSKERAEGQSADEAQRVEQIAQQVREGTYKIDSAAIAERMLDRVLWDKE